MIGCNHSYERKQVINQINKFLYKNLLAIFSSCFQSASIDNIPLATSIISHSKIQATLFLPPYIITIASPSSDSAD